MKNSEMSSPKGEANSTYVFDNAGKESAARLATLSAIFDPGTVRHLEACGVGPGWHCLEVGGGGGSIATWLAERVGPTGGVLVTDIDPRFLESLKLPNLEVRLHNVISDPLPEAAFDLVHLRLVLMHLPDREKALARLFATLKPGGWLVDEEFESSATAADPMLNPGEVLLKTHAALARLLASRGVDRNYGRRLFGRLRAQGFVNVGAEGRVFMWHAGSPGALLLRANYEQLRSDMISGGYVTEEDFDRDVAQMDDPNFAMPSPILWAAWGQRPVA